MWFDGGRANASAMFIAHRAKPRLYDSTGVLGISMVKEKDYRTYSKVTQEGGKEQWQAEMTVAEQELKATAVSFLLEGHS